MRKRLRNILLSALLPALVAVGGCATNPVTGKKELVLISTESEIETGKEHYFTAQQAEGGPYTVDAALTEYVESVGRRVAAVSDRVLPYQFVVLNNSAANAWALPGGKIAVNRGLLLELDNEAELAAMLGHEVVHAAARHGARAMQRDLFFQAILLGVALSEKDSKHANYIVGAGKVALQLAGQKYGRNAEHTSDYHGMKYMRAAGYDTAAAVTLQEKFVALSKGRKANWFERLFASHPPSAERVKRNRETLAEFPGGDTLGRARYQKQLAYLRDRQDAYEHADRARQLLDTDPESALNAINKAIAREPKEPVFYGIKGHILAEQQRHREAVREYDAAIERGPAYYEYFLGRGLANYHLGRKQPAQHDLDRSNRLLPTALASYNLGRIALEDGNRTRAKQLFEEAGDAGGDIGNAARAAFVTLDIADAPERYVDTEIFFEEDEIVVEVTNRTAYPLRNIILRVNADINEQPTSRRVSLAQLGAHATEVVASGVRYREEDAVEVKTRVLQARTADDI